MSDQKAPQGEDIPGPAREALDKPHLTAAELEQEVGDSDPWDEASEDSNAAEDRN
jgi:hypothetical protein